MKLRVLIRGAGWYGCHCASVLDEMGLEFDMCDATDGFFNGSSSKNQNRLHLGFHYPRSRKTRKECKKGYDKFMETYGGFTNPIEKNYYCIDRRSAIDAGTYESIYEHEETRFEKPRALDLPFDCATDAWEGFFRVDERFIDFRKAAEYFRNRFSDRMIDSYDERMLSVREDGVFYGEIRYDLMIDCTYSTIGNMFYERCVSLLYRYKGSDSFAITVMDGDFWSLFPYDTERKLFTLTDVEHTPKGDESARFDIEKKVRRYVPSFDDWFEYRGFFVSQKAKPGDVNTDDRSVAWEAGERVMRFSGGKITGIFAMEEILRSELKKRSAVARSELDERADASFEVLWRKIGCFETDASAIALHSGYRMRPIDGR